VSHEETEQRMTNEVVALVVLLILGGCARDESRTLTERQKFEMSKKCVDAGMYPEIWRTSVTCMSAPDHEVEK
jgi:hypothetical protein